MSAFRDKVSGCAVNLSTCAYSVHSSKDGMSTGRDSVSGLRYKVSTYIDQMSALKY